MRTTQQQKAIEVFCREVACKFQERGLDKVAVLQHKAIPVDWNQDSVKEDIFKPIMSALCYDKDGKPKTSTTQLDVMEVSEVYEHMNRWLGQNFGFSLPFPSDNEV